MNDVRIARITGAFGLACVALTFGQFPLWLGNSPSVYDGSGLARARSETEWIGTLFFGAALGWVAVTVVAEPMIWFLGT